MMTQEQFSRLCDAARDEYICLDERAACVVLATEIEGWFAAEIVRGKSLNRALADILELITVIAKG